MELQHRHEADRASGARAASVVDVRDIATHDVDAPTAGTAAPSDERAILATHVQVMEEGHARIGARMRAYFNEDEE